MMSEVSPGAVAAVAVLVAAGVADVVVIAVSGDSITACVRRNPAACALGGLVFVLHCADVLGPVDPFRVVTAAGSRLFSRHLRR